VTLGYAEAGDTSWMKRLNSAISACDGGR